MTKSVILFILDFSNLLTLMSAETDKTQKRIGIDEELDRYFANHDRDNALNLRNQLSPNITAEQIREKIRVRNKDGVMFRAEREHQFILLIRIGEIINFIEEYQKSGNAIEKELINEARDLMWLLDGARYDTKNLHSIIGKIAFTEAKKRIESLNPLEITDDEIKYIENLLRSAMDGGISIDAEWKKFHLMVTKKRVKKVMGEGMLEN